MSYRAGSVLEDKAFATGCLEVMFTLEGRPWEIKVNDSFKRTSPIELWGQILQPLTFRTSGGHEVFGIRFYPATAGFWLKEGINIFNDGVFDYTDVAGPEIKDLHEQLQEVDTVGERIALADVYLQKKLITNPKTVSKIDLVQKVMNEMTHKDFFDNIDNVAARYGITSRYLQKIFVQHTGLTPKLYTKINRFQNSLVMMSKSDLPLTSVAYACGYFDQSHFIREFKSFTGFSPSAFDPTHSSAVLASPNK
jgi:AraC-like DNA-binding protein